MWRVARDSRTLDLNSPYAYTLLARDFSDTCRVAVVDDRVAGFVTGYARPSDPACVFVWQVAVDEEHRGLGLAGRMLHDLVAGPGATFRTMQTTITDDNTASQQLFRGFARRWGDAPVTVQPLFESEHLAPPGDDGAHHAPERLYEIGPTRQR